MSDIAYREYDLVDRPHCDGATRYETKAVQEKARARVPIFKREIRYRCRHYLDEHGEELPSRTEI